MKTISITIGVFLVMASMVCGQGKPSGGNVIENNIVVNNCTMFGEVKGWKVIYYLKDKKIVDDVLSLTVDTAIIRAKEIQKKYPGLNVFIQEYTLKGN